MTTPPISHPAGYALPELMIALVLTGVLLSGLYRGYLWLQRAWIDWNRQSTLYTDVHRIQTQWVRDVTYAAAWAVSADTAWRLTDPSGGQVQYAFRDTVLLRNNRLLHHGAVQVTQFEVQAVGEDGEPEMVWPDSLAGPSVLVSLTCTLRAWQYEMTQSVHAVLRPPGPWPPMPVLYDP